MYSNIFLIYLECTLLNVEDKGKIAGQTHLNVREIVRNFVQIFWIGWYLDPFVM